MIWVNNRYKYVPLIIVVIATIGTYFFTFHFPFYFDDYLSVINNPLLREPELALKPRFVTNPNTRFVSMLIYSLAYAIDGLNTFYFRIIGFSVHLLNGVLLFFLVKQIFDYLSFKNGVAASSLAALIFWLHPLQSQAVVYISQNMAVFSTFFYLLSILIYFNFRIGKINYNNRGWIMILLLILFVIGIQCKQISGTIPISLLLIEIFLLPIKTKYFSKKWIFVLTVFIGFLIFTYLFFDFVTIETSEFSRLQYLQTQFFVVSNYLFLLVWPAKLSIDHQPQLITSIFSVNFAIGFLVIGSILTLAGFLYKNHRIITYSIFFVFVALSLESSIIPIRDLMFEHRMYLPMIGISLGFGYLFSLLPKGKLVLFLGLLVLFVVVTSSRLKVWQTDVDLWKNAVAVSPNSARAHTNLGVAYHNLDSLALAEQYFKKALEIDANYYQALNNMGLILMKQEKFNEAIHYLRKSISFNPKNKFAYNNIGICWENIGAKKEALKYYNLALSNDPFFIDALINKAVMLESLDRYKEALKVYDRVLKQRPKNFKALYNSGNVYLKTNQFENSVEYYLKAINVDSSSSDAYMNLAIAYYNLNKFKEALTYAQKAVELNPNHPQFQGNLATIQNALTKK